MMDLKEIDRLAKIVKGRSLPMDCVDDMVEMFSYQDSEGRELLFDLISRFEVCEFTQYKAKGRELAEALLPMQSSKLTSVVLMPILDKTPAAKSKSGDAVAWMMSRRVKRLAEASGRTFAMASQSLDPWIIDHADVTAFLLVDDYVGSGRTAVTAVENLKALGVPAANITVGAYVGMQAADTLLGPTGVRTLFLSRLPKGISDAPGIADKPNAIALMRRMEDKLRVGKKFWLGYESSEALALMCFCPNNTFPVFWWRGPTWDGVFER